MPSTAVVLASAVLWFFSTGAHHNWLLAWIAPAPILAYAYSAHLRRAAAATFAVAVLGSLTWVQLYHGLLPAVVLVRAVVGEGLLFTAVVVGARFIWRRQPLHVALFAFPVLLTAAEYLVGLVSVDGSFASLAYTQANFLTILQVTSVAGLAGVTFLVSLVSSGIAVAWLRRGEFRDFGVALAVPAIVVACAAAFGTVRLSLPPDGPAIRVGVAATDTTVGLYDTTRTDDALAVVRAYAGRVAQLGADGATMVVLPEKFVGITPADREAAQQILAQAAARAHVWLVAGFNEIGVTPLRNVAVVFTPGGQVAIRYLKQHLLPAFESGYQAGHSVAVWNANGSEAGVAICKDMDFPALGRAYADRKVGIMLVPAWDFVRDGWLHARMALVRGVEGGFSVVRAAQQGRLTVSDPYGRVVAEQRSDASPAVLLAGDVQTVHVTTIYDRIGDWFAWACLIVAAGMFAASIPRRTGAEDDQPAS